MHLSASTVTMPLVSFWVAPVGQTSTQGASLQWLQRIGWNTSFPVGYVPVSPINTLLQKTPEAVAFLPLQAIVQALHPTQRFKSITIPYLIIFSPFLQLVDLYSWTLFDSSADWVDCL